MRILPHLWPHLSFFFNLQAIAVVLTDNELRVGLSGSVASKQKKLEHWWFFLLPPEKNSHPI